ncbi:MAG: metalloregulator ArsR/SmtB family transcription factor [Acidimicrobiales bacterium]|nr:metalloregulator ArsR/SmtB family transcription factor [Acidimicrobiales bacterium]MEC7144564.1 metalloregulator ArsR/SmtB family transcription factor [Actinomycetota bacterium]HBH77055.1 transcriptional regulator [Acidimicrobiaceae bacterium]MEC7375367.1 metalloregulator ArsR/SmtB family transcription factor [Actinomycetota bacterium]MEC7672272.1 metalloregulator ArsR/SmtB family transcription factor [Actinomycetota bacterium]|tara:strand:- start:107 stop:442 length:336 start_codon:yes stop_codon:yes gene_type:complete
MALAETTTVETEGDLEGALKALASDKRLKILDWLKDVQANFPPQEHGDPVTEGACNLFIVEKLGVSQPTGSRHLKVLVDAGLVVATRRKGWTYYRRNEDAIAAVAERMREI